MVKGKYSKENYLSVGTLITLLIRQGEFKGKPQRLCCYYVLFDLFRSEGQNDSPFTPFLLAILEQKDNLKNLNVEKAESNFIKHLLSNGVKELSKQTPIQVLKADLLNKPVEINLPSIEHKYQQYLVDVPKVDLGATILDGSNEDSLIPDSPTLKDSFVPEILTIPPPLFSDDVENELVWLHYTNNSYFEPIYDTSNEIGLQAKNLLELAFIQTIALPDQHVLLEELKKDPDLVYQIGLAPERVSFSYFLFRIDFFIYGLHDH